MISLAKFEADSTATEGLTSFLVFVNSQRFWICGDVPRREMLHRSVSSVKTTQGIPH